MIAGLLRSALTGALLAACAPHAAFAALGGEDLVEIRAVIYRQVGALRRDAAREAFAFASPEVRAAFRSPEHFMRDARASYAPLYRSSSLAFRAIWVVDDEIVQPVSVTDRTGAQWSVYFPMQRQRDGSWKTNAWRLVPGAPPSI
jgi:hypothetical protein